MMNYSTLKGLNIPEGKVLKILVDDNTHWQEKAEVSTPKFNYVSFGDSIAAGHLINNEWHDPPYYGHQSQYGQQYANADGSTLIVENTYTDVMRKYLYGIYGKENVSAKSFARSGSRVYKPDGADRENQSLTCVVEHEIVKQAIREADLITICIGANDILEPATGKYLEPYLTEGLDLAPLESEVEDSLRILEDNDHSLSYWALFEKINKLIKPTTKVVFTTIYNPLKYLYIERGTWDNDYKDGLFGVWLDTIPDLSLLGRPDWLDIDKTIKKGIMSTPAFVRLVDRINVLGDWAEKYIDTSGTSVNGEKWNGLNHIIRNKVKEYQAVNPNFIVAETHKLYDSVPDRTGAGDLHYNDLVNCQVTKGFDANNLEWSRLWGDAEGNTASEKITNYWTDIISRHFSELIAGNVDGISEEIMPDILWLVLYTAVDVHPRADGHYVMYRAFTDTLGWESLNSVTYNANGGAGSMSEQKVLDYSIVNNATKKVYSILNDNEFSPNKGHEFEAWKDQYGNVYSDGQAIHVDSDITLSAQWDPKQFMLTVVQADKSDFATISSSNYSDRKLSLNNIVQRLPENASAVIPSEHKIPVDYDTDVQVWVSDRVLDNRYDHANCRIFVHNTKTDKYDIKKKEGTEISGNFKMPANDVRIEFWYETKGSPLIYNAQVWWDVYIAGINPDSLT